MVAPERTKHAIKNTVSGFAFRILGLLMPFAIRTIMIQKLGVEYLGLNTLFSSILQVLSLTELGFASAIVFAMYKPIAEGDTAKICALLRFLRNVYHIIGAIIVVVGAAISPLLPYLINGTYPADINLYLLYFIYLFNTAISYFLFAYKGLLLTAHQRSDIENIINMLANLVMYGIQITVLLLFKNYYIYIIFLPICTIAINLIRALIVNKKYPEYRCSGILEKPERKKVFNNIFALLGHRVSFVVVASINNIIISAFLGLEIMAIYGNYYYIVNALIGIITVFHSSITAGIGNSIVVDDIKKNHEDFKKLTFLNVWVVGWMAICLICLFQHFIRIWVGDALSLPLHTVGLLVAYFYLWKFKDILATYKDAAGMWRADLWKPYVVVLVSLGLSLLLTYFIGINGTLISIIAGAFVISMPWETHVFFKGYFKQSEGAYYLRMLIYTLVLIAIGAATYFICYLLPNTGYGWFALKAVICLIVPNLLIVLCSFMTPEFKGVMRKVKQMLFRKKEKNGFAEINGGEVSAETDDKTDDSLSANDNHYEGEKIDNE